MWMPVEFLEEEKDLYFNINGADYGSHIWTKGDIHRAGLLAYIAEAIVIALSTIHLFQ
jgi:hypothetical protein